MARVGLEVLREMAKRVVPRRVQVPRVQPQQAHLDMRELDAALLGHRLKVGERLAVISLVKGDDSVARVDTVQHGVAKRSAAFDQYATRDLHLSDCERPAEQLGRRAAILPGDFAGRLVANGDCIGADQHAFTHVVCHERELWSPVLVALLVWVRLRRLLADVFVMLEVLTAVILRELVFHGNLDQMAEDTGEALVPLLTRLEIGDQSGRWRLEALRTTRELGGV